MFFIIIIIFFFIYLFLMFLFSVIEALFFSPIIANSSSTGPFQFNWSFQHIQGSSSIHASSNFVFYFLFLFFPMPVRTLSKLVWGSNYLDCISYFYFHYSCFIFRKFPLNFCKLSLCWAMFTVVKLVKILYNFLLMLDLLAFKLDR